MMMFFFWMMFALSFSTYLSHILTRTQSDNSFKLQYRSTTSWFNAKTRYDTVRGEAITNIASCEFRNEL